MPRNPLFSTYRQGENRVTSSIVAVFQRIEMSLVERLLASATGESVLSMVQFVNQVAERGSVPDAEISADFRYLFEVKTTHGALRREQLAAPRGHLAKLKRPDSDERLFVVTPDLAEPALIAEIGDPRLVWLNFVGLSHAIDEVLSDPMELVSEQARFLLRELQALFAEDGLLSADDVVVVAARHAYPEYVKYGAYVCQQGREFGDGVSRMGFYANGAIQRELPLIRHIEATVTFTEDGIAQIRARNDELSRQVAELTERLLSDGLRKNGQILEVVLLTAANDDSGTLRLPHPILNTKRDRNGQPWGWTLSQRRTRSQLLLAGPETTDELDAADG